jgi:hypothetical protein
MHHWIFLYLMFVGFHVVLLSFYFTNVGNSTTRIFYIHTSWLDIFWPSYRTMKVILRTEKYPSNVIVAMTCVRQQKKYFSIQDTSSMHPYFHYNSIHFHMLLYASIRFHTLPLHFPALPYTSLHFTTLPYTSLHFPTLPCTSIHFYTLPYTSMHFYALPYNPYPSTNRSKT